MRLNKFIASTGHCSRRKADEFIKAGNVKVNQKIAELGTTVTPGEDTVTIDGQLLEAPSNFTYLLFHKPEGYVCTKSDPHAEQTIYNLLPEEFHHLNPVGRLDKNTEGLLILTNDGDFAYKMTHPKHGSEKTYQVIVKKIPSKENLNKLEQGIDIQEEKGTYHTQPCEITPQNSPNIFKITIKEGRKRQIRKMFERIGSPVVYLKRLKMGPYRLGDLPKGNWKQLTSI